jgi:hypothetical protein
MISINLFHTSWWQPTSVKPTSHVTRVEVWNFSVHVNMLFAWSTVTANQLFVKPFFTPKPCYDIHLIKLTRQHNLWFVCHIISKKNQTSKIYYKIIINFVEALFPLTFIYSHGPGQIKCWTNFPLKIYTVSLLIKCTRSFFNCHLNI